MNNIRGVFYNPMERGTDNHPIREIKKVKMNYKVDELTECGRIYKKKELIKAFDEALKNHPTVHNTPVVSNSSELYTYINGNLKPVVLLKNIIGTFKGYEIKDNGEVFINVKPMIHTDLFDLFLISPGFVGLFRGDNTVDIHLLVGFFLVGKTDIISPKKYFNTENSKQGELK